PTSYRRRSLLPCALRVAVISPLLSVVCRRHPSSPLFPYTTLFRSRGPGDFFGSRQHGLPALQIADLAADTRTLHAAQSEAGHTRSEEHTSELQSRFDIVCRLLLEKKNKHARTPDSLFAAHFRHVCV